jgi:hypothetical protein
MQLFQSATKLTKLSLVFCNLLVPEMKELTQLAQQKPILPNIVKIEYYDDEDSSYSSEVNNEIMNDLFHTLEETCPNLVPLETVLGNKQKIALGKTQDFYNYYFTYR